MLGFWELAFNFLLWVWCGWFLVLPAVWALSCISRVFAVRFTVRFPDFRFSWCF